MTTATTAARAVPAPSGTARLTASERPGGPLPLPDLAALGTLLEDAGLTGRGGAGFPTARKLGAVAGGPRRPVVVGNAVEGEPLSGKDRWLLERAPHLVLDGLAVAAHALDAHRVVLAAGPRTDPGPARAEAAARGRPGRAPAVEVRTLAGGFVAGQESAVVRALQGGPGLPTDPHTPVRERGVERRPTLVLNAETLAHLGLLARHGATWFRTAGTPEDPGTSLVTVSGTADVVAAPGVLEVERGTPLRALLQATGTDLARVRAVLVGGFHGAWVPGDRLDAALSAEGLRPWGASVGAGVVQVLDDRTCPLAHVAGVAGWLADQVAGQCGPCVNGLPRMADTLARLARPGTAPAEAHLVAEVARLRALVVGRGACAHPDGTARLVASSTDVFADDVAAHLTGRCVAGQGTDRGTGGWGR